MLKLNDSWYALDLLASVGALAGLYAQERLRNMSGSSDRALWLAVRFAIDMKRP